MAATDRILGDIHADDEETLKQIRVILAGNRIVNQLKQMDITARCGLGDVVVSAFERGKAGPMRIVNISKYAGEFGLALKVSFDGLDLLSEPSPELSSLMNLTDSLPFNGMWLEALVIAYLRQVRLDLQIPTHLMAQKLGLKADTLSKWENEGTDPHLYRMFAYARQLGGVMGLELYRP